MIKRNIVAGIVGIALVGGFLGFLCVWLKAVPLIVISAGVMAMLIYDFVTSMKEISNTTET